jgi:hypothetical protein
MKSEVYGEDIPGEYLAWSRCWLFFAPPPTVFVAQTTPFILLWKIMSRSARVWTLSPRK